MEINMANEEKNKKNSFFLLKFKTKTLSDKTKQIIKKLNQYTPTIEQICIIVSNSEKV